MMLCSFYDPKRGYQAEQYWPKENNSISFSNKTLKVTNLGSKSIDDLFEERIFKIEGPEGEKELRHLHVEYCCYEVDRLV